MGAKIQEKELREKLRDAVTHQFLRFVLRDNEIVMSDEAADDKYTPHQSPHPMQLFHHPHLLKPYSSRQHPLLGHQQFTKVLAISPSLAVLTYLKSRYVSLYPRGKYASGVEASARAECHNQPIV